MANWIDEKTASEKLGYKPYTLRRYAKSGKLDISYTTLRGRKFFYCEKSIEKQLTKKAIIL